MSHDFSRRAFVVRGLSVVSAAYTLPGFLHNTSEVLGAAAPLNRPEPKGGDQPILVVVQLSGGNDGLSTVIPLDNDDYRRARPQLAIAKNLLTLGGTPEGAKVALHPNLIALKSLYDEGDLAVIQGVGYPNPNRSHFRSMEIWQTADPVKPPVDGWLGRYFDSQCSGIDPKDVPDPKSAVNIGSLAPLALQGEKFTAISFQRPEAYQWFAGNRAIDPRMKQTFNEVNDLSHPMHAGDTPTNSIPPSSAHANPTLDFLERTALEAQLSSDEIRAVTTKYRGGVTYPNSPLASSLQMVAQMIAGGLSTRVYYVSLGGFDTHSNEGPQHDRLMTVLSEGLAAFMKDLKTQGNDKRTLVMTFSEFGRRVSENASKGTDHGTAAPMFLLGSMVKSGVYGAHPSLRATDLDHGDLKFHTDFRSIYATILDGWLKTDSKKILMGGFKNLPLLRA